MLIPMKELNAKIPDINGTISQIYFLDDDLLAKRFRRMTDHEKRSRIDRYNYIDSFSNLKNISLPIDILETEKGFCGYIEKIIPGTFSGELINYSDYYNEHCYDITLDDITTYMLNVCETVELCHKNGIINPDMASVNNVLFNKSNGSLSFLDYHDMQVKDIQSNVISSFISDDPILKNKKYYDKGFYTPNIDLYTLAVRFFYYATKINVPRAMQNIYEIDDLLKLVEISDTHFGECMRTLYNPYVDNMNIKEAIIELNENYNLSPFRKGQVRKLLRK